MFVVKYGSQSILSSIFSNQRHGVLLTQQKCQTRIRLIIFMCMIWPLLEKKLAIIGSTSQPSPRGSPLSSMRSKCFCTIQEQRTRNKSQRPRDKMAQAKERGRGGEERRRNPFFPSPSPLFPFFNTETKRKRLLRRLPTKT